MRLISITKILCITFISVSVFAQTKEVPNSMNQFESTLEVLRDAELYPTQKMLCGPGCLYIAVRYFGIKEYSVNEIAKMTDWNIANGTSTLGLQNACKEMSLYSEAFSLNASQLEKTMNHSNAVAILESNDHYYVLLKAKNGKFFCATTPLNTDWVDKKKLTELWDGKVLLLSKSPINISLGGISLFQGLVGLVGLIIILVISVRSFQGKSIQNKRL